ncbi:MAG TPA: DNA polymerase III subunit alpha [Gemmatimonadales bacterium]|nr:DNA polymerase III subunit alpha [Gemmatimonadales bacterium]
MYTHLHVHSHFSFGIGVSSPEALAEAAARRGFRALACTDTNGVYGAVEFQRACEAAAVRPVLGAHLVAEGQEVVALAINERGWAALCRAITEIHWRTVKPLDPSACPPVRLSAFLATDRDGLILLSRDTGFLEQVLRLSGPENLYAELRPGRERHAVLAAARRLSLPVVATNGVVAAQAEEWSRHRLLRAIALNTTLSALPSEEVWPPQAWLCPTDDLARHFPDCPEALRAAVEIAERCTYTIPVGHRIVPPRLADTGGAFAQLRELTLEGARRRYPVITPDLQERLDLELGIIRQKGFADYFLVVRDIVRNGPTHCGRGSVANSVVSYCLGITHVDPISSKLVFERFLNLERCDPPDIDLDFPWDERDKVLAYVFRRYPRLHSAMVANHNTFQPRGALREVAKVHGRPAGEIREVTRRIPYFYETGERLADLVAAHPNFRGLHLATSWQEYARIAEGLVGIPRHLSVHAGGVVITPTPLTDYVPVEPAAKTLTDDPDLAVPVIQFEKDGTEDAGLVKIDLLGNRSLAVIRDAIDAVHGHTSHRIDYTSSVAGQDEGAKALFRTGKTMGVFYTESPASRLLCAKSQADTFELLVLNTSMIRPASNKYIRLYLERLRNGMPYEPLDPSLRDTLLESFGIMVYQEDVVNVCATFAGMSPATGDGLRKALSKKRPAKHLGAYAEEFFTGAMRLGRDPDAAKKVWEMIMSFAGYSFCKGHSCSYIQIAQHACALRANHPAEFMAAVLSNGGGFYQPFAYVAEAMRMGLTVLPPDINASDFRCLGKGQEIRIGLQFVKGLSADAVERIMTARHACHPEHSEGSLDCTRRDPSVTPLPQDDNQGVPFRSIFDLRARTEIAPSDLRLLIKVGALDSIAGGWTRPMMLWMVDSAGQRDGGAAGRSQHTDADSIAGAHCPAAPLPRRPADWFDDLPPAVPTLKEYSPERRRREEYEALGFMTDAHPMQLHTERLRRFRLCRSTELQQHAGRHVLAAGMLTTAKPVHTTRDEPMEFATFDDGDGLIEAVLFPRIYRERGHVLFDQGPFIFRGKVEEEFGAVTLSVTHLDRLERVRPKLRR